MRKASEGRPIAMDEDDEHFLLHCIESKSTARGRRHDPVMYLNQRVKKRDFLKLINCKEVSTPSNQQRQPIIGKDLIISVQLKKNVI